MSFMRFLDLTISDDVPDSKTVWNFREKLIDLGVINDLFSIFTENLEKLGLIVNQGRIIDASFVEVPRQRNKKDENESIKNGEIPNNFKENPKKLPQKDTDARWTKKNNISYFGYKNHIKIDSKSKIIVKYMVTSASVHDSRALEGLLDANDEGQDLHADSAYTGKNLDKTISNRKITGKIIEKGYKNKLLTGEQKTFNKEKSKIRSRVEHVFGFMEQCMNGMKVKNIGIQCVTAVIGLMNLTYNMFRKVQLVG